jgi:hypothetical protein
MKSFTVVLALLIFCTVASAQKTDSEAVVSAEKMNVFYRGVVNPVAVAVPGVKSDKITLTTSDGTITKGTSGWEIRPGEKTECVISVNVEGKKVAEKSFRIKMIPPPVAVFAGKYEGSIDMATASKTESIEAILTDFLWDLKFSIDSFVFATSRDGMDYEIKSGKGNKLTDEMKSMIASTQDGKYIAFKDIISIGPDGRNKKLNDIIIQIKR